MQLISVEKAKLVSLFIVSNPDGQPVREEMAKALTQQYEFAVFPTKIEDLQSDKIVFAEGNFNGTSIENLEIYSDGIIVSSKSPTDKIDSFVDDLLLWADKTFGLKRVETHTINKVYESHIVVRSEKRVLSLLDRLSSLETRLKKLLSETSNIEGEVTQFGFSLAVDHTSLAGLKPISFRLERKADTSFASNLYFSSAPLKTLDHLSLLESIESLV